MTKKNYVAIAKIIKEAIDFKKKNQLDNEALYISNHLADYFKDGNPRFNYDTFFIACGLKVKE